MVAACEKPRCSNKQVGITHASLLAPCLVKRHHRLTLQIGKHTSKKTSREEFHLSFSLCYTSLISPYSEDKNIGITKIKNLDANIDALKVKLTDANLKEIGSQIREEDVAGGRQYTSFAHTVWKYADTPKKQS
ncbi:unnamed protein product [Urochloa humidicola]